MVLFETKWIYTKSLAFKFSFEYDAVIIYITKGYLKSTGSNPFYWLIYLKYIFSLIPSISNVLFPEFFPECNFWDGGQISCCISWVFGLEAKFFQRGLKFENVVAIGNDKQFLPVYNWSLLFIFCQYIR